MRNIHQLTPEEIDRQIEELQEQLKQQNQFTDRPIDDVIAELEQQRFKEYKQQLKKNLVDNINSQKQGLKERIAFKVVCEKHLGKAPTQILLTVFRACVENNNWRLLQRIYQNRAVEIDSSMVSFLSSFYRKHILGQRITVLTNNNTEIYNDLLSTTAFWKWC